MSTQPRIVCDAVAPVFMELPYCMEVKFFQILDIKIGLFGQPDQKVHILVSEPKSMIPRPNW
jgi:hypothetical protein